MKLRKALAIMMAVCMFATLALTSSAVEAEITWEGGAAPNEGAIAFISTANLVKGTAYTLKFTVNSTVDVPMEDRGACVWVRWAKDDHNNAKGVDALDGSGARNYVDKASDVIPAGVQGFVVGKNEVTINFVYGEANAYTEESFFDDANVIAISMGGGIGDYTLADITLVEAGAAPAAAPAAGDTAAATAGDDKGADTGIADIAVVIGLAAVATTGVIISKKRK